MRMSNVPEEIKKYIEQELTIEQQEICYKHGNFIVRACPGSGKTRTVGTRFAWRIANWKSRMGGVAAISFTNVACEEIGKHISNLGLPYKPKWPHFLGTIHSFVDQFISYRLDIRL